MFKSQIARTFLCLALVFVLVFNIYAMPTKAVAFGSAVTVAAGIFVTAALVALGISPGSSPDDFNSIVSSCTTALQQAGVIGERVSGYLCDGKVNFWSRLIDEVRSWTHQEDIVDFYALSYSGSFAFRTSTADYVSTVPVFPLIVKFKSGSKTYFKGYYFSDEAGSIQYRSSPTASYSTKNLTNNGGYSFGYYSIFFNGEVSSVTTSIPVVDRGTVSVSSSDYVPDFDWHTYVGASSSYDVSLGDVAPDNTELSSHYTDWAAGAISVPGSAVGADTDEDVVSFPLGLGDSVDDTAVLDQSTVQSGVGTYTGEVVEPEGDDTVDPDVSGAVSASVLAGLLDKLQGAIANRLDSLINLLTVVQNWCTNWWDKLGTTFPTILSEWWQDSVWTHIDDTFDSVLIGIRDGISGVKQWIDTAWDDFITTFPTAMSKWWEDVWTHVDDTFDSVLVGIRDGIAGIRTWANSFWDTLTITLPLTLSDWWSKVWADARSIPDFLTDALGLAADKVVTAVNDLIVPPEDYLSDKLNAIKEKYSFVESILATIGLIQNALNVSNTEPPVIYAELGAAESQYGYEYGGRVAILDMRWYAEYKPTVDKLLSAFFIFCFCWKIFKKLPGYIQGAPDDISFGSSGLPAVTHRTSSFKTDIKSISVRRGR